MIVVTVVNNILYRSVCPTSLPTYTNGMRSNTDNATAPYFAGEVISYECNDTYEPSPSDAVLNCTCVANATNDPPTASWSCNPDALTTSCEESEFLNLTQMIFKSKT